MKPRWKAVIVYSTQSGPVDVEHHFEEIADLHDIIESGPHWDTILKCTITLARRSEDEVGLTVEKAAEL